MEGIKNELKYATVDFKIDSDLYAQVREILKPYGLTPEDAIILFMKETVRLGKIPFEYTDEDLREAKRRYSDAPGGAQIDMERKPSSLTGKELSDPTVVVFV